MPRNSVKNLKKRSRRFLRSLKSSSSIITEKEKKNSLVSTLIHLFKTWKLLSVLFLRQALCTLWTPLLLLKGSSWFLLAMYLDLSWILAKIKFCLLKVLTSKFWILLLLSRLWYTLLKSAGSEASLDWLISKDWIVNFCSPSSYLTDYLQVSAIASQSSFLTLRRTVKKWNTVPEAF